MNEGIYFKVYFHVKGLEGSLYENIVGLEDAMGAELIRVYNIYADKANAEITEKLNEEFKQLYPTYFEDTKDKEWYELTEYNKFMAESYQRLIVDEMNETGISPLLNFYVDPVEVVFTGYLKMDRNVTINFSMGMV